MKSVHKVNRVNWARFYATKKDDFWKEVVFSDEKKFNLDGPDGFGYHWRHLDNDQRVFLIWDSWNMRQAEVVQ